MRELISAILKTGSSGVASIFFNIVANKILAVFLGPIYFGILTVFRQLQQTLVGFATFGGKTAIIEGISSKKNEDEQLRYQSVTVLAIFSFTVITVIAFWILAPKLAESYLDDSSPVAVRNIRLISIPLISNVLYFLISSILNGYREIGRIALLAGLVALMNATVAFPLTLFYPTENYFPLVIYLFAGNFTSFLLGVYFLWYKRKKPFLTFKLKWNEETKKYLFHFLSFSVLIALGTFILNGYISWIQAILAKNKTLAYAGFFMVAWTFSPRYLNLVLNSFGTYYLPTLIKKKTTEEKNELIWSVQRISLIMILPLIVGMMLFREEVLLILYSEKYLTALSVISVMLVGDFFKVISWTFGINVLANADTKFFFLKEFTISSVFMAGSYVSITYFDRFDGIGYAYLVMYVLNALILIIYSVKKYGYKLNKRVATTALFSLTLISLTFFVFIFYGALNGFIPRVIWLVLSATVALTFINSDERAKAIEFVRKKIKR